MCRIMEELRAEGKAEGIAIGEALISLLVSQNRVNDLMRSTQDIEFQKQLLKEFGLA